MHAPPGRSVIAPTLNTRLEQALVARLNALSDRPGALGELEPLAVRIGLMQNTVQPRLESPQLVVVAGDHGIAVDGLADPASPSTADWVAQLAEGRTALALLARDQQIPLTLLDAGVASVLPAHERVMARKIAYGTRNARLTHAMSLDQAHAAIRAGMELGDALTGNVLMVAGIGVGASVSAGMLLSRLSGAPVQGLLGHGVASPQATLAHVTQVAQAALQRHPEADDPVEALAALGGFEMAMIVGLILVKAGKRHLVMVDGLPALAALMVASKIAPPVTDYCVFCRSHPHPSLDQALALFRASALLELGMDATDGTGITLAWPLLRSAAALLAGDESERSAHAADASAAGRADSGFDAGPAGAVLASSFPAPLSETGPLSSR